MSGKLMKKQSKKRNYMKENDAIAKHYIKYPETLTEEVLKVMIWMIPSYIPKSTVMSMTDEEKEKAKMPEDKAYYWLKSYFYHTKDLGLGQKRNIGKFEIKSVWYKGYLSNSGKNWMDSQTKYVVTNTETGNTFDVGDIYDGGPRNRRSRVVMSNRLG